MKEKDKGDDSKVERGDETAEMDSSTAVHCLRKGAPCLDLATTKDFLRFHIALSQGDFSWCAATERAPSQNILRIPIRTSAYLSNINISR
jgi:hypothetical protein